MTSEKPVNESNKLNLSLKLVSDQNSDQNSELPKLVSQIKLPAELRFDLPPAMQEQLKLKLVEQIQALDQNSEPSSELQINLPTELRFDLPPLQEQFKPSSELPKLLKKVGLSELKLPELEVNLQSAQQEVNQQQLLIGDLRQKVTQLERELVRIKRNASNQSASVVTSTINTSAFGRFGSSDEVFWRRGNRIIAFCSGGAFLGGILAQGLGAVVGAIAGASLGLLTKAD
ncbi:MAG: hypothetical protein HC769_06055 [Cyanobacteria bacterium CRU_2_1]|nr:hypothetical protein [Cyanobacteria bacterium RU_5_0]NJR58451.1 hypothetical protein [Cyanobacteria bacterium CRU_2_1]